MSVAKSLGTPNERIRLVLTPEPSIEQKHNRWEQERDVLLEMVSKNQQLLRQAQETWQKEKDDLVSKNQSETQTLQKKLTETRNEVRLLQSELRKTGEGKIKVELLKELEKLELKAQHKESDMNHQIIELKNQVFSLETSITQNEYRICEEKKRLQTKLENERNESRRIQIDLQRNIDELYNRCEKANNEVYHKTQELERLKSRFEEKFKKPNKREGEDRLREKNDKSKILNIKEQPINSELERLHQEKANIENFYAEKIQRLEMQARLFRKKYDDMVQNAQEKQEQLQAEIERLSLANTRILSLSQHKESKTDQDYQSLSEQLKTIQTHYENREKTYLQDTHRLVQYTSTYEDLLKQYHEQELKGTPAANALRNEIDVLQKRLTDKEEQMSNLRELYLSSKHNERQTITKTVSSVQTLLDDIRNQQKSLLSEECNYIQILRKIDKENTEREKEQAQRYHEICSELGNLRKKYKDYKSNNWERQVQQLTEKNVKLNQEVDTARINIIHNHKVIQELQKAKEKSPVNDHIRKQQTEINILNSENQTLVENMKSLEIYYKKEIDNLQAVIERKKYQIEQILSKSDKTRANKAKKHLDDFTLWQSREEILNKTIKNLENKLKALITQEEAKKTLNSFEVTLETEELKLLRKEVGEKEDWINKLKSTFDEERRTYEIEVKRLREVVYSYRMSQDDKTKLLSEEHSLLKNNREMLLTMTDEVKRQMKILSRNKELTNKFNEKLVKESEDRSKRKMKTSQDQSDILKKSFVNQEIHQSELEQVRSNLTSQVNSLKERECRLNTQILAQQEEIAQLTRRLSEEKQQNNEEIQTLQTEIQSLKQVNVKRQNLMRKEKDSLVSDIKRLLGISQHKDNSNPFLDKINEIYNALEGKSFEDLCKEVRNTQEDTSPSEIEIYNEILQLKNMEIERRKQSDKEKETLQLVSQRLHQSLQNLLDYTQAENEDIAKDLEITRKKLKTVQTDKERFKKQRDDLVKTLSKARSLSKTDKSAVSKLINQMKSSPRASLLVNNSK